MAHMKCNMALTKGNMALRHVRNIWLDETLQMPCGHIEAKHHYAYVLRPA